MKLFIVVATLAAMAVALIACGKFVASIPRAFRSDGEGAEARLMVLMAPVGLVLVLVVAAGYRYQSVQTIDNLLRGSNTASVQDAPQHHHHAHKHK